MSWEWELLLAICLFLGAALYSSVGHAGASAYIAIMALFGVAPSVMRPTALVLNVLVSAYASWRYVGAGLFRGRTLWPVLVGAIPCAFIGGSIQLPGQYYRPLIGGVLLVAAVRLLSSSEHQMARAPIDIPVGLGVLAGCGIGLLSGLTGTGGGIFLSPLLLLMGWSDARTASGVAAVFILCNSIAGLLGNLASVRALPPDLPLLAAAALAGAVVGTMLGVGRFSNRVILKALGVVLIIAGLKMIGVY